MDNEIAERAFSVTTGLLEAADLEFLVTHTEQLAYDYTNRPLYRSETEMRVSILTDMRFPTPQSKYWQCIREQATMWAGVIDDSAQYQLCQIDIQLMERSLARLERDQPEDYDLHIQRLELEMLSKHRAMREHQAHAKDRVRELRLWRTIMDELCAEGPIDTVNIEAGQLESLTRRYQNQLKNLGDRATPTEISSLMGQFNQAMVEKVKRELLLKQAG